MTISKIKMGLQKMASVVVDACKNAFEYAKDKAASIGAAVGIGYGALCGSVAQAQTNFPSANDVTAAVEAGGTVFETVAGIVLAALGFTILLAFASRVKSRKG